MKKDPLATWLSRSRSAIAALVAAVILVVGSASIVTGATPVTQWGWVVVRQAAPATSPYTPDAPDQGNSSGGTNLVYHPSTGLYVIFLGDLGTPPVGIAHVSMLGSKHAICSPDVPFQDAGDTIIDVNCFDDTPSADPAGSRRWSQAITRSAGSTARGRMTCRSSRSGRSRDGA